MALLRDSIFPLISQLAGWTWWIGTESDPIGIPISIPQWNSVSIGIQYSSVVLYSSATVWSHSHRHSDSETVRLVLNIPHIYCIDHVLQLTAKNAYLDSWFKVAVVGDASLAPTANLALDEVVELSTMAKARLLVQYFSRSNQALASLKKQQVAMQSYNRKVPVGVVVDVVTRWWSTFSMCERLLVLKQALQSVAVDNQIPAAKILTDTDWEVIELIHKVLKPFKSAQTVLKGEKYTTVSLVPTVIKAIQKELA
jgi:hypothetical protein